MSRRLHAPRPLLCLAGATLVIGLALTACTPQGTTEPGPSAAPSVSSAPSAAPAPEPSFHPEGTAEDNLPVFTKIVEQVGASPENVSGRAYIDALVAAGFDRTGMQVTEDGTTVGNPAESIQFSVRWGDDLCLVGQVGPSTGAPVTMIMDQLAEGRCLIGNTRPIDW